MNYKILTPSVTIFGNDGKIDYDGNKKVINHLIEGGVDGIVPLGSTGEFTSMTLKEKKDFIEFYVKEVNERVELLPGTGSNNFEETVELSNFALELGVKGVLVISPYYYAMDQEDIFYYYDTLAKKLNGNLYIYNFLERSGHDVAPETMYKLVKENKNIVGMKDTTSSIPHTKATLIKIMKEFPDFELYSGFDDHFMANTIAGGRGCIAALSNIAPELWAEWVKAVNEKDFDKYIKIEGIINEMMALYSLDSNFSYLFKRMMKYAGLDINTTSLFPFDTMEESVYQKGIEIMDKSYLKYRKGE